jgi:choice-of-anchor A domain-containing protein
MLLFGGYDVVVFGNMSTNAQVEGSAIIGGNLTGNGETFAGSLSSAKKTDDTLLIGGNDTSGNISLQNGSAIVDGTVSNKMNLNGGGTLTTNAGSVVTNLLAPLESSLKSASMSYAALAQSSNASITNGVFSVTGADTGKTEVFDVQSGSLFQQNALIDLTSSLAPASAVIPAPFGAGHARHGGSRRCGP